MRQDAQVHGTWERDGREEPSAGDRTRPGAGDDGRAPKADAATLGVVPGHCAFHVERVARDAHGPFEYTTSLMRGDRYRIQWVLRNPDAAEPAADSTPEGATT